MLSPKMRLEQLRSHDDRERRHARPRALYFTKLVSMGRSLYFTKLVSMGRSLYFTKLVSMGVPSILQNWLAWGVPSILQNWLAWSMRIQFQSIGRKLRSVPPSISE